MLPAIGLLLSTALYPLGTHLPSLVFLGTVAVTAWYGGLRAGYAATVVSVLAMNFFFHPPQYRLTFTTEAGIELFIFAAIATMTSKLVAERHSALEQLYRTNERLEELVAERTRELSRANELLLRVNSKLQSEILERQQAERELSRSNEELEQFASAASHDLQEPLRTIASLSQLLERNYRNRLEPEAQELLDAVRQAVVRMGLLVADLLEYARLGGQKKEELVDCNEALATALEQLRTSIVDTGSDVTSDSLPSVAGNRTQLVQLFQNLVGNAVKYRSSDRPLRVHVSTQREDGHWTFSVADNGQGFDPSKADRIFGVFKRLHGRDIPGTGIGLALCKRIVEHHGGSIHAQSEPGRGSTFVFTLPMPRKESGETAGTPA